MFPLGVLHASSPAGPPLKTLGVTVVPNAAGQNDPVNRLANTSGNTITFTVTNTGDQDTGFSKTCVGTGSVSTVTCTNIGTLEAGQQVTVTATFSVTGAGSGTITLTATSTNPAGVSASGKWNITVVNPVATVTPDGTAVTVAPNTGTNYTFTVTNSGTAQTTYSLVAFCSGTGVAAGCTVSPASLTVNPSLNGSATISYTTQAAGATGKVVLRALVASTVLDTGYISVSIPNASVTPDAQPVTVQPSSANNQVFTINNNGLVGVTYSLSATCTGAGLVAGCTVSPTSVLVQPGQNGTTTLSYTSTANGTGTATVGASYGGVLLDNGSINVTVNAPAANVFPQGHVDGDTVQRAPNTATSQVFTVNNTGGGNTSYALTATCTGVGGSCSISPNPLPVNQGLSGNATVTFTGLAQGSAGKVILRASVAGVLLDTGYVNTTVVGANLTPTGHVDGFAVTATAFTPGSQTFTVNNTGTTTTVYTLTASCSGSGGVSGCAVSGSTSLSVNGAQASPPVTVTYNPQGGGTTGVVALRASFLGVIVDSGYVNVSVLAPPMAPAVDVASVNPGAVLARGQCATIAIGSAAASECEDLRLVHVFPAVKTMNKIRAPTLIYNSAHAAPYPIVAANVTLPSGALTPTSVTATLTILSVIRASGCLL
jgi:hypothetical protein